MQAVTVLRFCNLSLHVEGAIKNVRYRKLMKEGEYFICVSFINIINWEGKETKGKGDLKNFVRLIMGGCKQLGGIVVWKLQYNWRCTSLHGNSKI